MTTLTCQVIDSHTGRPASGMPVALRCLAHRYVPFQSHVISDDRGCHWDLTSFMHAAAVHVEAVWQMGFDTSTYYGREKTSWPGVDVCFYVRRGERYLITLYIGPENYKMYGKLLSQPQAVANQTMQSSAVQSPLLSGHAPNQQATANAFKRAQTPALAPPSKLMPIERQRALDLDQLQSNKSMAPPSVYPEPNKQGLQTYRAKPPERCNVGGGTGSRAHEASPPTLLPSIHDLLNVAGNGAMSGASSSIFNISRIPQSTEGTRLLQQGPRAADTSIKVAPVSTSTRGTEQQRQTRSLPPVSHPRIADPPNRGEQTGHKSTNESSHHVGTRSNQDVHQWLEQVRKPRLNASEHTEILPTLENFRSQLHSKITLQFPDPAGLIPPTGPLYNTIMQACVACRSSKMKCSGGRPCARCRWYMEACLYTATEMRPATPEIGFQADVKSISDLPQVSQPATVDTLGEEPAPQIVDQSNDSSRQLWQSNVPPTSQAREQGDTIRNRNNTSTFATSLSNQNEPDRKGISQGEEGVAGHSSSVSKFSDLRTDSQTGGRLEQLSLAADIVSKQLQHENEQTTSSAASEPALQPQNEAKASGAGTSADPVDLEEFLGAEPMHVDDPDVPPNTPKTESGDSQDGDPFIIVAVPRILRSQTRKDMIGKANRKGRTRKTH